MKARLGNEIVTLGNVSGIDQGQQYERLYKINKNLTKDYKKPPIYPFLEILVIRVKKNKNPLLSFNTLATTLL